MTPNTTRTISRKAWNSPVEYSIWEYKADINDSNMFNPIFQKKVQGRKPPRSRAIVEHIYNNIFTETNMVANPRKRMWWNIIMCTKSCFLITDFCYYSLLIPRWVFKWLTTIVFHINGNCWSFSKKFQYNITIYNYHMTALQIDTSLLKEPSTIITISGGQIRNHQFPSGQGGEPAFRQGKLR